MGLPEILRFSTVSSKCLPAYLIKQTSLKEPSWMSLYKGLAAYLVYPYLESLGVVRGDQCEIRESLFRHC